MVGAGLSPRAARVPAGRLTAPTLTSPGRAVLATSSYQKSQARDTVNSTDSLYDAALLVPVTGNVTAGYAGAFGIGAAEAIFPPVMVDHQELTAFDNTVEQLRQQHVRERTGDGIR